MLSDVRIPWTVFLLCLAGVANAESVPLVDIDLIRNVNYDPRKFDQGQIDAHRFPELPSPQPASMAFSSIAPMVVTHVAWNDHEQDGLLNDVTVSVFKADQYPMGDLVFSSTIPANSDVELTSAGWRWLAVPEFVLEPGYY